MLWYLEIGENPIDGQNKRGECNAARIGTDAPGTLHNVIIRRIEQKSIVLDDTDRKTFVDGIFLYRTLIEGTSKELFHIRIVALSRQVGIEILIPKAFGTPSALHSGCSRHFFEVP